MPQKFQLYEFQIVKELPRPLKAIRVGEFSWTTDAVRLFVLLQDNLIISLTRKASYRKLSARPLQIKRLRPNDLEKMYQVRRINQQTKEKTK